MKTQLGILFLSVVVILFGLGCGRGESVAMASASDGLQPGVLLTHYASPAEADFGSEMSDEAEWHLPGDSRIHVSRFARGFTSKTAHDPKNENLYGVGMEGSGFIDLKAHPDDEDLAQAFLAGYRVLNVERLDSKTGRMLFVLTDAPLNNTGKGLVPYRSAAVRAGNPRFPMNRWVKIEVNGREAEFRKIEDLCPGCRENQIDLYVDSSDSLASKTGAVTVMPVGFSPHEPE